MPDLEVSKKSDTSLNMSNFINQIFIKVCDFINQHEFKYNENNLSIYKIVNFLVSINHIYSFDLKTMCFSLLKLTNNPHIKGQINNAGRGETGEFLEASSKKFNILHYYSFLNSVMNIEKFKFIFTNEILPRIKNIAIKVWEEDKNPHLKTETKIHNAITKELPEGLLTQKQIMYMAEVHPLTNRQNKQRVDILLSASNYYISVELKTLADGRNTDGSLEKQLKKYTSNQLVSTHNYLILFETKNHNKERTKQIEKIAKANNFISKKIRINYNTKKPK